MKKKPKQPNAPAVSRRPIEVNTYFKNGKMVKGYKRRVPGSAHQKG